MWYVIHVCILLPHDITCLCVNCQFYQPSLYCMQVFRWQIFLLSFHATFPSSIFCFRLYVRLGNELDFKRLQTHFTSQEVLVRFLDSHSWAREVLPANELEPFYWAMGLVPPADHSLSELSSRNAAKFGLGAVSACSALSACSSQASSSPWQCSIAGGNSIQERLILGRHVYQQKERLRATFTPIQHTIWERVEQYLSSGSHKDLMKVVALLHLRGKHQMKAFAERHSKNLLRLESVIQKLRSDSDAAGEADDSGSDGESTDGDEPENTFYTHSQLSACSKLPASSWQSKPHIGSVTFLDMDVATASSAEQIDLASKNFRQTPLQTYAFPLLL